MLKRCSNRQRNSTHTHTYTCHMAFWVAGGADGMRCSGYGDVNFSDVSSYRTCRFSQLFDFESRAHTRPNKPFTFKLADVRVPRILRGLNPHGKMEEN